MCFLRGELALGELRMCVMGNELHSIQKEQVQGYQLSHNQVIIYFYSILVIKCGTKNYS